MPPNEFDMFAFLRLCLFEVAAGHVRRALAEGRVWWVPPGQCGDRPNPRYGGPCTKPAGHDDGWHANGGEWRWQVLPKRATRWPGER